MTKLRRICQVKDSGKCNVPQQIYEEFLAGGTQRVELRKLFVSCKLDKDYMWMSIVP